MENAAKMLIALGLSEKAATIYLTLLGTSRMGIAEMSRTSGIKRATCYEQLDHLLRQGFVAKVPVGKRTYYTAESPTKVLSEFKKKTVAFERQVDELEQLHDKATNKARVIFFEGKQQIRNIYNDLFTTVGDAYSIFPAEAFFKSFTEEDYDEFDKVISGHAFKAKDLFVADKYYKKIKTIRERNKADHKLDKRLPPDFKSNVDVLIGSDKVALISLRDLSAIVIENADIAELFRSMHQFMWRAL